MNTKEKETWNQVTALLSEDAYTLGKHWSYNFLKDPRRFGFVLSRYKFASKMIPPKASILELGCSEGIGTSILSETATSYIGVDLDSQAIHDAKAIFKEGKIRFIHDDFMGKIYGSFDALVSLDVIEHILPEHEQEYMETIYNNVNSGGIALIGTPSIESAQYASEESKLGHVNMFSLERLKKTCETYFHTVLPFGMNDEVVHAGYSKMCHYAYCVCCNKKERVL